MKNADKGMYVVDLENLTDFVLTLIKEKTT